MAAEMLLQTLEVKFGAVPAEIADRVRGMSDTERLRRLHREAVLAESLDAWMAILGS